MSSGKAGCANHIDVTLKCDDDGLFGCLEQWSADDVKAHIGKGRCNDICPAVMAILPHLGDEQFWLAAQATFNRRDAIKDLCPAFVEFVRATVNALNGDWRCCVSAKYQLHGVRYFAKRCARAGGINSLSKQIILEIPFASSGDERPLGVARCLVSARHERGVAGGLSESLQRSLTGTFVTRGAGGGKTHNLALADKVIVYFKRIEFVFGGELIFVDANDDIFAFIYPRLTCSSGFFNEALGHAGGDGLGHAAQFINFANDLPSLIHQFGG